MATHLSRRRFTVSEYHHMAEAGILTEDDRLELLDGEIVEMTPIGRRHAACVDRLTELFVHTFVDVALTRVQGPVQLGERTEPLPDVALLRRRPDFYASGHPTAADILLLVEVAETSATVDRRVKVALYAANGIAEFWLIELAKETITVYRDPESRGYRTTQVAHRGYRTTRVAHRGDLLAPATFPNREMAVDLIFPGRKG